MNDHDWVHHSPGFSLRCLNCGRYWPPDQTERQQGRCKPRTAPLGGTVDPQ